MKPAMISGVEAPSVGLAFTLLVASSIIFRLVVNLYQYFFSAIPTLPPIRFRSWKDITTEAYYRVNKASLPYRYGKAIVIPPQLFGEARKQPARVLSSTGSIEETLFFRYFLVDDHMDIMNFVRTEVNRSIPKLIPAVEDEVGRMLHKFFPAKGSKSFVEDGKTWYTFSLYPQVQSGLGCIASRLFGGRKYAHNEAWTTLASQYALGIYWNAQLFRVLPHWMRVIVARFSPTKRRVAGLKDMMKEDVLEYARHSGGNEDRIWELGERQETMLLPALVKYVQRHPNYASGDVDKIWNGTFGRFMSLLFASIDTTTITTSHALFDLMSQPRDIIEVIIDEFTQVRKIYDGVWSQAALQDLKHLDSFIKESQRLHSLGFIFPVRLVVSPEGCTLPAVPGVSKSKPIHIPYRSRVEMPLWGVHSDPSNYEAPETFNGFRFVKENNPATQISDKFLSFGHGIHACPGRYLAVIVIKLIIVRFLGDFEFKQIERPGDICIGGGRLPNFTAKVHVRKKTDV